MTTTSELLAKLNSLRVANGAQPLKAWKESRQKLEDLLSRLDNPEPIPCAVTIDPVQEFIATKGVTQCPPSKALQEDAKRKEMVDKLVAKRLNGTKEAVVLSSKFDKLASQATPKVARQMRQLKAKVEHDANSVTLVSIAAEIGIDAKIARAKMRRVSVPSDFLIVGQKHTYHNAHKQWVIDVLRKDMRKEPRK